MAGVESVSLLKAAAAIQQSVDVTSGMQDQCAGIFQEKLGMFIFMCIFLQLNVGSLFTF